jgi:hypothetical protein
VLLYSREWLRSRNVVLGGPIQLCIPPHDVRGEGRVEAIKPSLAVPQGEGLVVTFVRQKLQAEEEQLPPVEMRDWQQVHVVLDESDGKQVYVVMLHSREWLRLHGGLIGGPIYLNLPQHEVHGEGRVTFVEPSPTISDGEGRVMTFVRGHRKAHGATNPAPIFKPVNPPGLRTYFGERLPPVGHEWVRIAFDSGAGLMADLTLTRSEEWLRANWQAVETLRKDQDVPQDIEPTSLVRVCVNVEAGKRVHIAFFWPARWVQAHGLTVDESLFLRLPKEQLFGEGRLAAIDPAPFVPRKGEPRSMMFISGQKQDGTKGKIESAAVGDYALTYTAEERGEEPALDLDGKWVARQRVRLLLEKEEGGEVTVVLLRATEWVQAEGIEPGGSVYLDMPEQGTMGWAKVQAVEPCLVFRPSGNLGVRLVTGTFRHSEGWAGDLKLKGASAPIGVTPGHLFWSVDRQEWVPVSDLRLGETVKTLKGTTTVESYTMRDRREPVYNLEVEHDHVFRVGDQGILVHNTSNPTKAELKSLAQTFRQQRGWTDGKKNLGGIIYIRKKDCKELRITMTFPDTFEISDRTGHTEDQINQKLTADPDIDNMAGSIQILLFFTERSPCRTCTIKRIPDLEKKNGGPFDIVYFVDYGSGGSETDAALAKYYGFS